MQWLSAQAAGKAIGAGRPRRYAEVPHDTHTTAAALQHNLPVMIAFELSAVSDADDGELLGLLQKQTHQQILAARIERRGRFVHDDNIGLIEKDTGKRESLLFSARENLIPG